MIDIIMVIMAIPMTATIPLVTSIQLEWIGILLGVIGIIITIFLTILIRKYDKDRRDRENERYKTRIESHANKIWNYFVKIDNISRVENNIEEVESEDQMDEIKEVIIGELDQYYQQNQENMRRLLSDAQEDLKLWKVTDKNELKKYEGIIEDFNWLANDYSFHEKNEDRKLQLWEDHHEEVTEKRYKIDNLVH